MKSVLFVFLEDRPVPYRGDLIDFDKMEACAAQAREELFYNTGIHFEKYGHIPKKVTGYKARVVKKSKDFLANKKL